MAPCLLLPGLDGTARLFAQFIAAAPPGLPLQPLALPHDRPRSYAELVDWVLERAPPEPFALIAESFSGPLAILVADRCPRVTAVVLCASFVDPPLPRALANLPRFVLHRSPPLAALRVLLTGGDHALATEVRAATSTVPPVVIAHRIVSVLRVDVAAELARLTAPLLVLRASRDRLIPARATARVATLAPSAQIETIDAPHLLLQTRPHDAWARIAPFLARAP